MLIGLRELQHRHSPSRWEDLAYRLWKEVLRRPVLYRVALGTARLVLRMIARDGWIRRLPGAGGAWTQSRDFPAPAPRSFRDQWKSL
jgi:L-lactate dehydrogenase complex protein LldF